MPNPTRCCVAALILTTLCAAPQSAPAQSTTDSTQPLYMLERIEQTKRGQVQHTTPGRSEVSTPFGKKNPKLKFYRRYGFQDGNIDVVIKDNQNVGAVGKPKIIRFGREDELSITYTPPAKTLKPRQSILIPVNWSVSTKIGCYNRGGIEPRLSALLYEIRDKKEKVAQENLRKKSLMLSPDELKTACEKTRNTKTRKRATGSAKLLLKPSNKPPAKALIIRLEGPGTLGMLYHYRLNNANP